LILVSKGIIGLCENEDQLAAVLAHEIAHVQYGHGLKAIKKSRLTDALTVIATEGAKAFAGETVGPLTDAFEGSISDITGTLVNKGYARKQEYEADAGAIAILKAVGYDAGSLEESLQAMSNILDHADEPRGFGATHPPASDRIRKVSALTGEVPMMLEHVVRTKRFVTATHNL